MVDAGELAGAHALGVVVGDGDRVRLLQYAPLGSDTDRGGQRLLARADFMVNSDVHTLARHAENIPSEQRFIPYLAGHSLQARAWGRRASPPRGRNQSHSAHDLPTKSKTIVGFVVCGAVFVGRL